MKCFKTNIDCFRKKQQNTLQINTNSFTKYYLGSNELTVITFSQDQNHDFLMMNHIDLLIA